MPVVRNPGFRPARQGAGWAEQTWAGPRELGAPVPMQAWRWSLAPMAASPPIGLGAPEGLLYVMGGTGTADTDGGRFSAAAHFHAGCHHVFCVLAGEGLLCTDRAASRLTAGMSALTVPGELHWFVNDSDADFAFVEFWAPPPVDTVWPVAADRCTWAPVN